VYSSSRAHDACVGDGWSLRERLEQVPYREEPWASAYPDLVDVLKDDPRLPKYSVVERNAFVGGSILSPAMLQVALPVRDYGTVTSNLVRRVSTEEHGFVYEDGTATLDADNIAAERIDGWTPIPVGGIGLLGDADRDPGSGSESEPDPNPDADRHDRAPW